jgi:cob(I)alamin adenosyltransferase
MAFKIYTKTGDKGATSLIGGVRVPKSHIRIESYGTVDELNSYLGIVTDTVANDMICSWLREIQDRLFTIGSVLATAPDKKVKMALPEMRSFIIPGGHIVASYCHVARCICRRCERICVSMVEQDEYVPQVVLQYLNRLSDFLFVLSRYITHINSAEETPWRPRV